MSEASALGSIAYASREVQIHRVGYRPDVWQWTPWQYAVDGRFNGRWDDPDGVWRTMYVGDSRLACYLEILAPMRPDLVLADVLGEIEENDEDIATFPTLPSGRVPRSWCDSRLVGTGSLTGEFVLIGDMETISDLRKRFRGLALTLGLDDLDAAAIRIARPRALTQTIAAYLYQLATPAGRPVTGIEFSSRHADNCRLWAVFERDADTDLTIVPTPMNEPVDPFDPDLVEAMRLLDVEWAN
ncbi:RES domain-containing protein [Gordonia rubripertincta]|uniref:RES domain-containing protein n=1 Tax=Gordonia rubripertincta TaxID=36822 RepID=UPI0015F849D6|nr:RES domain-containing protein [Gordonia rubripertincta]QMU21486.1 RES domain-containing protein [Gordonia rubripertincta]